MNTTVEDFRNASVGATATHKTLVSRAMKMDGGKRRWVFPSGLETDDEDLERWGYTLDAPSPTTAREALDLAWELAHEVKPGKVIPEGTRFLEFYISGVREYTALCDFEISPELVPIRTLDPLPEPLPDWLDAPAVLAGFDGWDHDEREVFIPASALGRWVRAETDCTFHWSELRDVTPLYPKETGQ